MVPKLPASFKLKRASKGVYLFVPLDQKGIEKNHQELQKLRKKYAAHMKRNGFNGILIPGLPPPYFHRTAFNMAFGHGSNVLANAYRLPCMSVPVVTIGELDMYKPGEEVDDWNDYWSVMLRSLVNEGKGLKCGV